MSTTKRRKRFLKPQPELGKTPAEMTDRELERNMAALWQSEEPTAFWQWCDLFEEEQRRKYSAAAAKPARVVSIKGAM